MAPRRPDLLVRLSSLPQRCFEMMRRFFVLGPRLPDDRGDLPADISFCQFSGFLRGPPDTSR